MKIKHAVATGLLVIAFAFGLTAAAGSGVGQDKKEGENLAPPAASATHTVQDDAARLDGEKRFRANCGRCHAAPPKFAPRVMATVIRHMRVRATITDEEMRLILRYMTE